MGAFSFLFKQSIESFGHGSNDLPNIYPFGLKCEDFIFSSIIHTYTKILTDTIDRVHGIPEEVDPVLWDSCLQNNSSQGLITLLACAMANKRDLFLVYSPSVHVLRTATPKEQTQIESDYKKTGESKVGIYVSFKNYRITDQLKIYAVFEHCVLCSLNKTLGLSQAIQIKINELRATTSLNDSSIARAQAQAIARGLGAGLDVLLDAKDAIETAKPDTSTAEKAISFLDAKRAFILTLPIAYISGINTPGIGATGEADMRAIERGLKQFYVSILRPILIALFQLKKLEFRSQDFREVTSALEVLKTFDLTSDENLSAETKQAITARVFDVDEEEEKKRLESEAAERAKLAPVVPPPTVVPPTDNPAVAVPAQTKTTA